MAPPEMPQSTWKPVWPQLRTASRIAGGPILPRGRTTAYNPQKTRLWHPRCQRQRRLPLSWVSFAPPVPHSPLLRPAVSWDPLSSDFLPGVLPGGATGDEGMGTLGCLSPTPNTSVPFCWARVGPRLRPRNATPVLTSAQAQP